MRPHMLDGGAHNLEVFHPLYSLHQPRQNFSYFCINSVAVGLGAFLVFPQAERNDVIAFRTNKSDFILEALLFAKQREYFRLQTYGRNRCGRMVLIPLKPDAYMTFSVLVIGQRDTSVNSFG